MDFIEASPPIQAAEVSDTAEQQLGTVNKSAIQLVDGKSGLKLLEQALKQSKKFWKGSLPTVQCVCIRTSWLDIRHDMEREFILSICCCKLIWRDPLLSLLN
jgi:hypothetical protein